MRLTLLLTTLLLTGCGTTAVPVAYKFPEAPEVLLKSCDPLAEYKEQTLSGIIKNTSDNLAAYHACATKHEAWIEWYREQKTIADEAGKK
jgi:hypothetical protein